MVGELLAVVGEWSAVIYVVWNVVCDWTRWSAARSIVVWNVVGDWTRWSAARSIVVWRRGLETWSGTACCDAYNYTE